MPEHVTDFAYNVFLCPFSGQCGIYSIKNSKIPNTRVYFYEQIDPKNVGSTTNINATILPEKV
jgi:hypothetical protein